MRKGIRGVFIIIIIATAIVNADRWVDKVGTSSDCLGTGTDACSRIVDAFAVVASGETIRIGAGIWDSVDERGATLADVSNVVIQGKCASILNRKITNACR